MQTVTVVFRKYGGWDNAKEYSYLYDGEETLVPNDLVIVDSPSDGPVVVKVVRVTDGAASKATKFLVQKVDLSGYIERTQRAARISEIKKDLEKRMREVHEESMYMLLATKDKDAAKLLKELKSLTN